MKLRLFLIMGALLAAFLSLVGCAGNGAGSQISNSFKLFDTVVELDKTGTIVTASTDSTVTLTGAPALSPGQVLIHNAEDGTDFVRTVVDSTVVGDTTTVNTVDATAEEVFETADIVEDKPFDSAKLAALVPAQEGVSFSAPSKPDSKGPNSGMTISFAKMALKDDGGTVICQIDGSVTLDAGVDTRFRKSGLRVDEFRVAPYVNIQGTLMARGRTSGSFSKEIPISLNAKIPITPLGPLGINCSFQLMMKVEGKYSAEGVFTVTADLRVKEGIQYTSSGGWSLVNEIDKTFGMTPPSLRTDIEMDVSLIRPKIGVDVAGIGEITGTVDVCEIVAKVTGTNIPTPGFVIEVLGDFNFTLTGAVKLGPITLWKESKTFDLARYTILEPFLLSNYGPKDTQIVYVDQGLKNLHVRDGDGANDRIIANSSTFIFAPNVSRRDGTICFGKTNASGVAEIWSCSPTGSNLRRITDGSLSINHPCWSPDGQRIAFDASDSSGVKQVYVVDVSSGATVKVTTAETASRIPCWSADGIYVYFERTTTAGTKVIARTRSTTPTYSVILANDTTSYSEPSMSPNGLQLVCILGGVDVHLSDELGRNEQVLFRDSHLSRPSFSPDGFRIILQYNDIAANNVVSYDLNGQNGVNYGIGQQPSWGVSH